MIPLFKLPLLAILNCLRLMDPFGLIDVSLLSKRAKFLAKSAHRTAIKVVSVNIDRKIEIGFQFPEYPDTEWIFTNKDIQIDEMGENETEDVLHTSKVTKWAQHLTYIFGSKIRFLIFRQYRTGKGDLGIPFLCWFCELSSRAEKLEFMKGFMDAFDIKYLLNNLKPSNYLCLQIFPASQFIYRSNIFPNARLLNIDIGGWVTLENLLSMRECNEIHISGSQLTDRHFNSFLDHWIDGDLPNLKFLNVYQCDPNDTDTRIPTIIQGLTTKQLDSSLTRIYEKLHWNAESIEIPLPGGYDVFAKRGVMATFNLHDENDIPCFRFHVCEP